MCSSWGVNKCAATSHMLTVGLQATATSLECTPHPSTPFTLRAGLATTFIQVSGLPSPMDAAAVVAELVDEVRIQEGEAKRHAAGAALLGEAFAQSSALFFATIRALRTYTAELEGAVQGLAPGHLQV